MPPTFDVLILPEPVAEFLGKGSVGFSFVLSSSVISIMAILRSRDDDLAYVVSIHFHHYHNNVITNIVITNITTRRSRLRRSG